MEVEQEVYKLSIILEKELSEIRKLMIPISLYFAEKLKEVKE
jgi:hypothetical protein